MVEGHGVHRVAAAHRRALMGKRFAATSPNGRFTQVGDDCVTGGAQSHGVRRVQRAACVSPGERMLADGVDVLAS